MDVEVFVRIASSNQKKAKVINTVKYFRIKIFSNHVLPLNAFLPFDLSLVKLQILGMCTGETDKAQLSYLSYLISVKHDKLVLFILVQISCFFLPCLILKNLEHMFDMH